MLPARLAAVCPGLLLPAEEVAGRTVLLPLGSYEDHDGLPAVLDTLLALEVSCRASAVCGLAVAWPLGYGFSPEHAWSVSLDEDEVARLVGRLAERLSRRTGAAVVVVDGHYGHREPVRRAVRCYVNVWDLLAEEGVRGFENQLAFERAYARGEAYELVERAARRLCAIATACSP